MGQRDKSKYREEKSGRDSDFKQIVRGKRAGVETPLWETRVWGSFYMKVGISAPVTQMCTQDDPDTISRQKTDSAEWLLQLRCRDVGRDKQSMIKGWTDIGANRQPEDVYSTHIHHHVVLWLVHALCSTWTHRHAYTCVCLCKHTHNK